MKIISLKKLLILVSILAIPGFLFFYLLPTFAKNRYHKLSIFGPKQVAGTFHSVRGKKIPDTIYHIISDFKFNNQKSEPISWQTYKNKIVIVNLFDVAGNNAVNLANKALLNFNDSYQKNALIYFMSVSVKPNEVLKQYAIDKKAKAPKWNMVSGDSTEVNRFIKNGLLLDVLSKKENGTTKFIYSNMFVLLDPQHRIRGFYDITNAEAMAKLDDEIKVLIAEDLRNVKDGR